MGWHFSSAKLRHFMDIRKHSIESLAEASGVSSASVELWLVDIFKPKPDNLEKLFNTLEIEPNDLFVFKEK